MKKIDVSFIKESSAKAVNLSKTIIKYTNECLKFYKTENSELKPKTNPFLYAQITLLLYEMTTSPNVL